MSRPGESYRERYVGCDNVHYLGYTRGANSNPVLHTRKRILREVDPTDNKQQGSKLNTKLPEYLAQALASSTIICLLKS